MKKKQTHHKSHARQRRPKQAQALKKKGWQQLVQRYTAL
jgi:hypothetical protein